MNKVEKIKAELERRIAEITDISQGYIADKQMKTEYLLLHELLSFIDSLSDTEKDFGIKESVIPFGASDSELMEATYFIPQGYHAVIDGNKVIIKKGDTKKDFSIKTKFKVGDTIRNKQWPTACHTIESIDSGSYYLDNGRKVEIAHQDLWELKEDPVSNDLEKAAHFYVDTTIEWFDSEGNPCCYPAFIAGAQWQKEQDQSTIELAEDHAMLAGMEKMKQEIMKNVVLETKVMKDNDGDGIDTPYEEWLTLEDTEIPFIPDNIGLKDGDKVKVIIIK